MGKDIARDSSSASVWSILLTGLHVMVVRSPSVARTVGLPTGPVGIHRACRFSDRGEEVTTPERNRPGNISPILCISPHVAHQLASARKILRIKLKVKLTIP